MRNTLILIGQIKTNKEEGLDDFHAVVEATVQRSRPVVLIALAAALAFIPLTFSVFWDLRVHPYRKDRGRHCTYARFFLPALHTIWFRVRSTVGEQEPEAQPAHRAGATRRSTNSAVERRAHAGEACSKEACHA